MWPFNKLFKGFKKGELQVVASGKGVGKTYYRQERKASGFSSGYSTPSRSDEGVPYVAPTSNYDFYNSTPSSTSHDSCSTTYDSGSSSYDSGSSCSSGDN